MLSKLSLNSSKRIFSILTRRFVSTSRRNNDTVAAKVSNEAKSKVADQNWMSYGYEYNSKKDDRNAMHSIMFVSITLCIVVGGFFFAYMPDNILRDWSQREAFLQLKIREKNGLPLIDRDYAKNVYLPSDAEIKDMEIIV